MDDFILRQEIISNLWLIIFIFFCSRFISGERSKGDWFPTDYFSYVHRKCQSIGFVGILILWLLSFTLNVYYIICYFFNEVIPEDILYFVLISIGALTAILPIIIVLLTLHYKSGSPYSNDQRAIKLLQRNRRIFIIQFAITTVSILICMICVYFVTGKNSSITFLLGAILGVITLISVYVYYSRKLRRELIYQSFQLVLQNKIKDINKWNHWLKLPQRKLLQLNRRLPQLLIMYGFQDRIHLQDGLFVD